MVCRPTSFWTSSPSAHLVHTLNHASGLSSVLTMLFCDRDLLSRTRRPYGRRRRLVPLQVCEQVEAQPHQALLCMCKVARTSTHAVSRVAHGCCTRYRRPCLRACRSHAAEVDAWCCSSPCVGCATLVRHGWESGVPVKSVITYMIMGLMGVPTGARPNCYS